MARLRYNGLTATLGASLTTSATAVTFGAALTHSGGTAVPTIGAGDYIPLTILDTSGQVSEIVYLTAYTSGATVGTIARAQESTAGVAHASGDKVLHALTVSDIATSPLTVKVAPVAAVASSGTNPEYAYDETANAWTTTSATTGTLRYQLPRSWVVTSYSITRVDGGTSDRNPTAWSFQGSADGTTWTTIDTRSGVTWPTAGEVKTFTAANTRQYLYYRLNITANNGSTDSLSVREFALLAVVPQVLRPVPIVAAVASSGTNPQYAYDETTNAWTTTTSTTGTLRYQLAKPLLVTDYSVTRFDTSGLTDRNPTAWSFQGSLDGVTWTTLDTRSAITWPTAGEVKAFTVATPGKYLYYRLNITANNGSSDSLSVQEFALTASVFNPASDELVVEYRSDWVAGTYPAGSMVRYLGTTFVSKASTAGTPQVPVYDYGSDFTSMPNLFVAPWAQGGTTTASPRSITVTTGETTPDAAVTTALRLHGGYVASTNLYVELTLTFSVAGSIAFYDRLSSEGGSDPGRFYIDGVLQHTQATNSVWTSRSYGVGVGTHVFRWLYTSDSSIQSLDDSYKIAKLRTTGSVLGSADWEPVGLDAEGSRDLVAGTLVAGPGMVVTVNDAADAITLGTVADSPPTGATSLDEFTDDSLDAAWVRVDGANVPAGAVTWTEAGGVLVASRVAGVGTDSSDSIHALLRPIGTAMATGDAITGAIKVQGGTQQFCAGMVLSTGVTYGAGAQLHTFSYNTDGLTVDLRKRTNFTTADGSGASARTIHAGALLHFRIVKLASDAWRMDTSINGRVWLLGTSTQTWAQAPTHVGFMVSGWSTDTTGQVEYSYLRRTSGVS